MGDPYQFHLKVGVCGQGKKKKKESLGTPHNVMFDWYKLRLF